MNYQRHYNLLIERAKLRGIDKSQLTGYYELHHVLPKCLGGSDDEANLVLLTAREHFVAHLLLTKFTTGSDRHKMLCALASFQMNKTGGRLLTGRQVCVARQANPSRKGVNATVLKCPYCGKLNNLGLSRRWHFDNCLRSPRQVLTICFSGPHRVGKGTSVDLLSKITSYSHVVFDRGFESTYAFAKVFGRAAIDLDAAIHDYFANPGACMVYYGLGLDDYESDRLLDKARKLHWVGAFVSEPEYEYTNRDLDLHINAAITRAELLGYSDRILRLTARESKPVDQLFETLAWLASSNLIKGRHSLTCPKCKLAGSLGNKKFTRHVRSCLG